MTISLPDDLTKDHRGKVTFINFLDFLVKQQQGTDPFDEVGQVRLGDFKYDSCMQHAKKSWPLPPIQTIRSVIYMADGRTSMTGTPLEP